MRARRTIWLDLACGALIAVIGCRSTTPELKPPTAPEVLNKPPDEARFNSAAYPKQALASDGTQKFSPAALSAKDARGGNMGPSMGGMGGGGGGGGGMGQGMGGGGGGSMGGFGR
jgi:hypothetical protein